MRIKKISGFKDYENFIKWQRTKQRKIERCEILDGLIRVYYEEIEGKNNAQYSIDQIRAMAFKWLKPSSCETDGLGGHPQSEPENERLLAFMDALDRLDSINIQAVVDDPEWEKLAEEAEKLLTIGIERLK